MIVSKEKENMTHSKKATLGLLSLSLPFMAGPYGMEDRIVTHSSEPKQYTTDYADKGAITRPYRKKDKLTRRERKYGKKNNKTKIQIRAKNITCK